MSEVREDAPPAISAGVCRHGLLNRKKLLNNGYRQCALTEPGGGSDLQAIRTSAAQKGINMTAQQQRLHTGQVTIPGWTPNTDVQIANGVLARRQY